MAKFLFCGQYVEWHTLVGDWAVWIRQYSPTGHDALYSVERWILEEKISELISNKM